VVAELGDIESNEASHPFLRTIQRSPLSSSRLIVNSTYGAIHFCPHGQCGLIGMRSGISCGAQTGKSGEFAASNTGRIDVPCVAFFRSK
jgi:hypothetical protein